MHLMYPFKKISFLLFAFSALPFLIVSQSISETELKNAHKNYLFYCAGCHGDKLEKFENKNWLYGNSEANISNSIKNGQDEMGMPSFAAAFNDAEIDALAAYIKRGGNSKQSITAGTPKPGIIESRDQKFIVDTVVSGLEIPWGLDFLPDGSMLIADRNGKMYHFTKDNELIQLRGVPDVIAKGQGGLMDIILHPKYKENGWIYFSYSAYSDEQGSEAGNTAIMRARLKGNQLVDKERIFKALPDTKRKHHYGSKITFDNEGFLYFSVGDRGEMKNAQTLKNDCGKIHRIHDDGSIPSDNPFVNVKGAMPSIFSYGHRNPQGVVFHKERNELYSSEHGPKGGDEINLVQKGLNYGWPEICYGINYNGTILTEFTEMEGMEQPIDYYVPSIAPCGMDILLGDKYPAWKDDIFMGSLKFKYLERAIMEDEKVIGHEKLLENIGRVRNVKVSPDGYLYVGIENPGKIIKLIPVND